MNPGNDIKRYLCYDYLTKHSKYCCSNFFLCPRSQPTLLKASNQLNYFQIHLYLSGITNMSSKKIETGATDFEELDWYCSFSLRIIRSLLSVLENFDSNLSNSYYRDLNYSPIFQQILKTYWKLMKDTGQTIPQYQDQYYLT
jgi:hypothetical protein